MDIFFDMGAAITIALIALTTRCIDNIPSNNSMLACVVIITTNSDIILALTITKNDVANNWINNFILSILLQNLNSFGLTIPITYAINGNNTTLIINIGTPEIRNEIKPTTPTSVTYFLLIYLLNDSYKIGLKKWN